jgi:hypothetical protein
MFVRISTKRREVLTDLHSLANLSQPEGFFDLIIEDHPSLASTGKSKPGIFHGQNQDEYGIFILLLNNVSLPYPRNQKRQDQVHDLGVMCQRG